MNDPIVKFQLGIIWVSGCIDPSYSNVRILDSIIFNPTEVKWNNNYKNDKKKNETTQYATIQLFVKLGITADKGNLSGFRFKRKGDERHCNSYNCF